MGDWRGAAVKCELLGFDGNDSSGVVQVQVTGMRRPQALTAFSSRSPRVMSRRPVGGFWTRQPQQQSTLLRRAWRRWVAWGASRRPRRMRPRAMRTCTQSSFYMTPAKPKAA